jgi:hypothetical protein
MTFICRSVYHQLNNRQLDFSMEEDLQGIQKATEVANEFLVSYGFQFLGALIIMFVGSNVAN